MNNDSWIPDYAQKVHDIVHKHGGKNLSRSGNITPIEGELPDLTVIALVEFPSVDAAKAFVSDPDYAPFAKTRQVGTDSNFYVIDNTDLTQEVPYLPPG